MLNQLQAEPALSIVREREDSQTQINPIVFPPETLDMSDMDLIIRSSDLVDFRVRKSVLAMASPFFKDLLSLPQPSDSEIVDGLPVIQMSEDSELLNSLVSILYPVRTVIPNSYEKVNYPCYSLATITNPLLQGVISTRCVPEIRDGFCTVIYPCRGQPRGIPSAIRSGGLFGLCDRECQRTHSRNGKCSTADVGSPYDIW